MYEFMTSILLYVMAQEVGRKTYISCWLSGALSKDAHGECLGLLAHSRVDNRDIGTPCCPLLLFFPYLRKMQMSPVELLIITQQVVYGSICFLCRAMYRLFARVGISEDKNERSDT